MAVFFLTYHQILLFPSVAFIWDIRRSNIARVTWNQRYGLEIVTMNVDQVTKYFQSVLFCCCGFGNPVQISHPNCCLVFLKVRCELSVVYMPVLFWVTFVIGIKHMALNQTTKNSNQQQNRCSRSKHLPLTCNIHHILHDF